MFLELLSKWISCKFLFSHFIVVGLQGLHKTFLRPQRSAKIKIYLKIKRFTPHLGLGLVKKLQKCANKSRLHYTNLLFKLKYICNKACLKWSSQNNKIVENSKSYCCVWLLLDRNTLKDRSVSENLPNLYVM